jgi:hypothetical protein
MRDHSVASLSESLNLPSNSQLSSTQLSSNTIEVEGSRREEEEETIGRMELEGSTEETLSNAIVAAAPGKNKSTRIGKDEESGVVEVIRRSSSPTLAHELNFRRRDLSPANQSDRDRARQGYFSLEGSRRGSDSSEIEKERERAKEMYWMG